MRQITDPLASPTGWWTDSAPLPFLRFRPGGSYLAYTTWSRRVELLGMKVQKSPAIAAPTTPSRANSLSTTRASCSP